MSVSLQLASSFTVAAAQQGAGSFYPDYCNKTLALIAGVDADQLPELIVHFTESGARITIPGEPEPAGVTETPVRFRFSTTFGWIRKDGISSLIGLSPEEADQIDEELARMQAERRIA